MSSFLDFNQQPSNGANGKGNGSLPAQTDLFGEPMKPVNGSNGANGSNGHAKLHTQQKDEIEKHIEADAMLRVMRGDQLRICERLTEIEKKLSVLEASHSEG